jgi:uncharacterized protein (DUF58 family)
VLDVSRSMDWTGAASRLTKLAYAERIAAAIALLLIRQRDAVGFIRFDDRIRSVVPPRARTAQWRRIVAAMMEGGSGQDSRAGEALMQAARMIRRPGLVIFISDLLMEPEDVEQPVRMLRAAGHDVTVIHVMDPSERDLTVAGEAVFRDPESEVEVPATVADVKSAYRATVDAALGEWRDLFNSVGAGYQTVMTDAPFGVPLRQAFSARQRLP